MTSSEPVVEQWTSLTNDRYVLHHGHNDQDPLRCTAQSFLECLDRYDHPGTSKLNSAYKEIIRICLKEILANRQSEIPNEASWKYNNINNQTISGIKPQTPVTFNEVIHLSLSDLPLVSQPSALQRLQAKLAGQEHSFLSQESHRVSSTLLEGTGHPLDQLSPGRVSYIHNLSFAYHTRVDFFPFGTSDSVSYGLGAQSSAHQHVTRSEEQTLPDPSTSRQRESHLPIAQGVQEKVKCTLPGCSSVVRKDSYTRHLNETHRRKVKAVCSRCEGHSRART